MQDQRRQEPRRSAVAIVVGMDRRILIVRDGGFDRNGELVLLIDPEDELAYQSGYILCLGEHVTDNAGPAFSNHFLPVPIWRRPGSRVSYAHDRAMKPSHR